MWPDSPKSDWQREYSQEYKNIPEVVCRRCKKELLRSDLVVSFDVEYGHPLNKGKRLEDDDMHVTRFEGCPFCKTMLFADGKKV